MAEQFDLTTPVTAPAQTKTSYKVIAITLDIEAMPTIPNGEVGLVHIRLKDNLGVYTTHRYEGNVAKNLILTLNTANLSTKSLHKRVLEKLAADGFISGTVTGTPDPPTP